MARTVLERRLIDVSDRLKRLRAELSVAEEQSAFLAGEADDARIRSLVSETPLAQAEAHETQRHADAQTRQRDRLRRAIADLERDQDALLDRMASELPASQRPGLPS
jgi:DnaJ-domain-containing protein 1